MTPVSLGGWEFGGGAWGVWVWGVKLDSPCIYRLSISIWGSPCV